jgi:hypothetical protein
VIRETQRGHAEILSELSGSSKNRKKMFKTIIGVVAFLVLALIFQLYEQNQLRIQIARQQQEKMKAQYDEAVKAEATERARQLQSGNPPQSMPAMENLAVGTFSVSNGTPKEFPINVDTSRMTEVNVKGQFAVSGKNSAVEVYIFDEDDYANWLYGNDSIAIYDSGRRTMGEIQARIVKSGRYFLILQNPSSSTPLDVRADIQMRFEKLTIPEFRIPNS